MRGEGCRVGRGRSVRGGGVSCGEGELRFVGFGSWVGSWRAGEGVVPVGEWAWVLLAEGWWWRGFGERWVIFFTFG